jgi:hypothetical protein
MSSEKFAAGDDGWWRILTGWWRTVEQLTVGWMLGSLMIRAA